MANCSQLTREWCRKCREETLFVIDRCNHCKTQRRIEMPVQAMTEWRSKPMTIKKERPRKVKTGRTEPVNLPLGGCSDEA